jgi:hypothetical protein
MNTNQTCPFCQHCSGSLNISLDSLAPNDRAVNVKTVCDALIDSRFGPGRPYPMLYHFSRDPNVKRTILFDMTEIGPVPSYTILPDSEIARRYAAAIIQDALIDSFAAARGSP